MGVFYKKLKSLCEKNNLKPSPLVRKLGLSATNLKRWENGSNVNSDILLKVSEYFDVPTDYLITDDFVLCSECRHYEVHKFGNGQCLKYNAAFPSNGFCSNGERREEL